MDNVRPRFQFRLSQMLKAVFLVAMLLAAYRVHWVLTAVAAYVAALCTVNTWPRPLRTLFISLSLATAAATFAAGAYLFAVILAIFMIAVIEAPIYRLPAARPAAPTRETSDRRRE